MALDNEGQRLSRWQAVISTAAKVGCAYARKIVGWRVSTTPHAGYVVYAFEPAVDERRPIKGMGFVHHSDCGSQSLSIKHTARQVETINGVFKAEVIHRRSPWRSFNAVGHAALEWPCGDASSACRLTGRRVQQLLSARTHREHPANRSRSQLQRISGN
ncbi:MAG: hypothetical protein ACRC14_13770 [Paracoccaceae bacterium]